MTILKNLKHRLPALAAWALALALATGAAFPQPSQAVGLQNSGHAQVHHGAMSGYQMQNLGVPMSLPRSLTIDDRKKNLRNCPFDIRCGLGGFHPGNTPPPGTCMAKWTGVAIGGGAGAIVGTALGSPGGPAGAAVGSFAGIALGSGVGGFVGVINFTRKHNSDGHHPGYLSNNKASGGKKRSGGKYWKCPSLS